MSAINILIYSGNGTSHNSLRHTQLTLKALLGHAYDVSTIDANTLEKEPWEASCAMLVMPGGRDLPYCNDLNGETNARIRRFVNEGGRYLGFCAGAYYGSAVIEFEKDRPSMEVCGNRELGFFPGMCRGTIYPGFVYESEDGACRATVLLDKEKLQPFYPGDVPGSIPMYYNGGGYFVAADSYPNVDVLGRFEAPGICADEERPAAVVQCRVGNGIATLIAPHPEYQIVQEKTQTLNTPLLESLEASEPDRKAFLRAVFARMGLTVVGYDRDTLQENKVPSLTPIYFSAIDSNLAQTVAATLRKTATHDILKDATNVFHLTSLDGVETASAQMAALSLEQQEEGPKSVTLVLPSTTSKENPCIPPRSLTPYFHLEAYYAALAKHRSQEWGGGKWYTFGSSMLYAEVISSTQTILDQNYTFAQALPNGLVCHATNQVAGRGRGKNTWVSQLGALQFSMVVRHSIKLNHAPVVFVQYLIALAVVESVRSRKGYEDVPLRLKWPNDIYAEVDGGQTLKKVAGLLVNSSFTQNEFLLVIGVGINLSNSHPTVSVNDVIQAHNPSLPRLTAEEMLAGVLVKFEKIYSQFCQEGMGRWFLDTYYARWLHSDKIVTLTTHDDELVKITGITSDYGMLEAVSVSDPRKRYTLQPDGNSFDMLKGLIKKKT